MKLFKKLAAFLLSLSMCASITACGQFSDNTNNSGNTDITSDNSGGTGNNSENGNQNGNNTVDASTYVAAIEQQLKEANTIKMTVVSKTMEDSQSSEGNYYYWSQEKVEYTYAKTEYGYNVYTKTTLETIYEKGGESEIYVSESYLIDGVEYYYDDEEERFVENGYIVMEGGQSWTGLIADILQDSEDVRKGLTDLFNEVVDINNSQATFIYEAVEEANGLLDYIGALNPETKTVASVLNDALGLFAEGLTVEALLAEIEALDALTVGQAETALDAYLQENAGMTLQEFKNSILDNESVKAMLAEQGMSEAQIAQLKQMSLKELLGYSEDDLFDKLVYDIVTLIPENANAEEGVEGETPSYEEFISRLTSKTPYDSLITYFLQDVIMPALNATLDEFAAQLDSENAVNTLDTLIIVGQALNVTKLGGQMKVTFGNMYNISKLEILAEFAYTAMMEGTEAIGGNSYAIYIDLISSDVTNIVLPN